MSEMIERVAQAIAAKYVGEESKYLNSLSLAYRGIARAAIEAMLKPTEAMIAAAVEEIDPGWIEYKSGEECWRAMIEEALR